MIATLQPDGSPHTAATWYLWENGRVLVNMDEGRKRLEHLRNDPRVSITVLGKDEWYHHVALQGRVISLDPDEELEDIDHLSRHYEASPTHSVTGVASALESKSSPGTRGPEASRGPELTDPIGRCGSVASLRHTSNI